MSSPARCKRNRGWSCCRDRDPRWSLWMWKWQRWRRSTPVHLKYLIESDAQALFANRLSGRAVSDGNGASSSPNCPSQRQRASLPSAKWKHSTTLCLSIVFVKTFGEHKFFLKSIFWPTVFFRKHSANPWTLSKPLISSSDYIWLEQIPSVSLKN